MNQENQPAKNLQFGEQVLNTITNEMHIDGEIVRMLRFLNELKK